VKIFAFIGYIGKTFFFFVRFNSFFLRLLHVTSPINLYKHIHKQHHKYRVTIGIAAEYAHPVEALLSNVFPTMLGPWLLGAHFYTVLTWVMLRVCESCFAHSGYSFPFSPWSLFPFQGGEERHDFHHSHNKGSFGSKTLAFHFSYHLRIVFLFLGLDYRY